jgi:phage N-6-adenine-methyltransferase
MTVNTGMMSQNSQTWSTPPNIFHDLNREFNFTTDVCALPENAKCDRYFTPDQNGLAQQWEGACWMNPPYGREIKAWMRKAYESSLSGATVVCLVPSRTCSAWWHDYAMKGEIRFLRGRVRFIGAAFNAPFPSAIVVFRAMLK